MKIEELASGRNAKSALLAALALAACGPAARPQTASAPPAPAYTLVVPVPPREHRVEGPAVLGATIDLLARNFPGRVGIAIRAVDAGWVVQSGGDQRLPQQSVSKTWVAMTVLDARDAGRLRLDDPVTVTSNDLTLFHQPIAMLVKGDGYHTTVGDLLTRALTHSDNTANDRLLTLVGGPAAVRDFLARKGLFGIGFGPGERRLQAATAGLVWQQSYAQGNNFEIARSRLPDAVRTAALDAYVANPPDGATPLGVTQALAKLARGELLSETSTRLMIETMGNSVTGRARLRAALPAGWTIAHKTGTGQDLGPRNAGFNDVGLLTAPDGTRYAIAVMIGDTMRPEHDRQLLIQAVASAVAGYQTTREANRGSASPGG